MAGWSRTNLARSSPDVQRNRTVLCALFPALTPIIDDLVDRAGLEPALTLASFPARMFWWQGWESNPQCSPALGHSFTDCCGQPFRYLAKYVWLGGQDLNLRLRPSEGRWNIQTSTPPNRISSTRAVALSLNVQGTGRARIRM